MFPSQVHLVRLPGDGANSHAAISTTSRLLVTGFSLRLKGEISGLRAITQGYISAHLYLMRQLHVEAVQRALAQLRAAQRLPQEHNHLRSEGQVGAGQASVTAQLAEC